jgi:dTDP-4-dehydrorhamnose 3,5-epimerase-like enzyme
MSDMKNKLKAFEDEMGCLLPIEFGDLDFEPKRVFVVSNVPVGNIRGNHSHYKTKQYLICINGEVNVLLDDGVAKETIHLVKNESILIPELVWDAQEFLTDDTEIMVICSTGYDLDDYILTYEDFQEAIR